MVGLDSEMVDISSYRVLGRLIIEMKPAISYFYKYVSFIRKD
jgi:hypothetical protein